MDKNLILRKLIGLKPQQHRQRFTILVPVCEANLYETLLHPAIRAAKKYNGKIILLNTVRVPFNTRNYMGKSFVTDRLQMLQNGQEMIKAASCECEIMVQVRHNLLSALKEVAKQRNVNLVIMGLRNKYEFILRRDLYHNVLSLNCPVILAKHNVKTDYKNVVILIDEVRNVIAVLEHAALLLSGKNSKIYVVHNSNKQQETDKLKTEIAKFEKEQNDIKSQVFLTPDFVKDDMIKRTATDDKKNSCIFYTYYKENRLKHILHAGKLIKTDSPLFLYKP